MRKLRKSRENVTTLQEGNRVAPLVSDRTRSYS